MPEAVAVEVEADPLLLSGGVVIHLERALLAPLGNHFAAQDLLPAGGEIEGRRHHDHRSDVGVARGGEGGKVATQGGADQDRPSVAHLALGEERLHLPERTAHRETEKALLALVEIGHLALHALRGEPLAEEARLLGGGARGEAVEIDEKGRFGRHRSTPGLGVFLTQAARLRFAEAEGDSAHGPRRSGRLESAGWRPKRIGRKERRGPSARRNSHEFTRGSRSSMRSSTKLGRRWTGSRPSPGSRRRSRSGGPRRRSSPPSFRRSPT